VLEKDAQIASEIKSVTMSQGGEKWNTSQKQKGRSLTGLAHFP